VDEPSRLYLAMDLLVLPSTSGEGSPGVIKEAAAAGIPVVATDISGTREILREGLEALLVPPRDDLALTRAMCRVAHDPSLARALSRAARDRVAAFSLEATAEKTLGIYREVLARRLRGAAGTAASSK
jgi:glycosyltransferase involved in cell wall biosynthesis